MKSKFFGLGLATLGFICATGLSLPHLPLLNQAAKLSIQPAQAGQLFAQNRPKNNQEQRNSIPTSLNREFKLKVGQTGIVAGENLKITFVKVSQDSRCPANTACIWAGQAVVVLNVVNDGQNLGEVVLTSRAGSPELAVKTLEDQSTLKLVDVQPEPIASSQTNKTNYTIRLIVSKTTTDGI